MNRRARKLALLMLTPVALASFAASAAHICRDEQGKTSYQDDPCPERKKSGIQPVKASTPDEASMLETVRRIERAVKARDSDAYVSLYSRDYKLTVTEKDGFVKRGGYHSLSRAGERVFDAADLNVTYQQCKPVPASKPDHGALLCALVSEAKVIKSAGRFEADTKLEFRVEGGLVKVILADVKVKSDKFEGPKYGQ